MAYDAVDYLNQTTPIPSSATGLSNAIISQATPPSSPAVGQRWEDTSLTPSALKVWDGTVWMVPLDQFNLDRIEQGIALASTAFVDSSTVGIAPGNTAAANNTAFEALSSTNKSIYFGPGDYQVANSGTGSTGEVLISDFDGMMLFHPKARVLLTDNDARGFRFLRGTHVIDGLSIAYQTAPTARTTGAQACHFDQTVDSMVSRYKVDQSPLFGLHFNRCSNLRLDNIRIRNTIADGLHLTDCTNFQGGYIWTHTTGDDGIGIDTWTGNTEGSNGFLHHITIRNSNSRGIWIAQKNVEVSDFDIKDTNGHGVAVFFDSAFDTHVPTGVKVHDGRIVNAGPYYDSRTYTGKLGQTSGPSGSTPGANGIHLVANPGGLAETEPFGVEMYNVEVDTVEGGYTDTTNTSSRGLHADVPNTGIFPASSYVRLRNIRVKNTPSYGFSFKVLNADVDGLVAEDTRENGINIVESTYVKAGRLQTINVARANTSTARAVNVSNSTVGLTETVSIDKVKVVDDQSTPTGHRFNVSSTAGTLKVHVHDVEFHLPNSAMPGNPITIPTTNVILGKVHYTGNNWTERISTDQGDVSVTLNQFSIRTLLFATTLTANRTVTLPAASSGNAYRGLRFRIIRTGLGAFTLDITVSGGASLKVIPASTAAWAEVEYDGTAWRLVGYGNL